MDVYFQGGRGWKNHTGEYIHTNCYGGVYIYSPWKHYFFTIKNYFYQLFNSVVFNLKQIGKNHPRLHNIAEQHQLNPRMNFKTEKSDLLTSPPPLWLSSYAHVSFHLPKIRQINLKYMLFNTHYSTQILVRLHKYIFSCKSAYLH